MEAVLRPSLLFLIAALPVHSGTGRGWHYVDFEYLRLRFSGTCGACLILVI